MTDVQDTALIDLSLYPEGASLDGDGRLLIGGCPVSELAAQYGTPAYLIDEGALRRHARAYVDAFRSRHPASTVLFASKSFPSASVLGVIAEEGCGADTAAAGELMMALAGGVDPQAIVFHGNAKTDVDIRTALEARVRFIVLDNRDDIERIERIAAELGIRERVPVLLRVSPTVTAATHAAMMTGHDASKFGIPSGLVAEVVDDVRRSARLDLRGLHAHVGSQLLDLSQFEAEVAGIAAYGRFPVYDLGGGLGVRYVSGDEAPSVDEYADRLVRAVHRHLGEEVELMVEPGRSMVARSGVTVYRVVTVKRGAGITHVAVDGGMGDNLEVALYGQAFQPSIIDRTGQTEVVDIEGRHCESGDRIARQVGVVSPRVGDLVTVPATGAYCFTMSNNYNAALRPPVVFCRDGVSRLAVRRETYDDLFRREQLVSRG